MWFNMLGHATYQLAVLFPLVYKGEDFFDIPLGRKLGHDHAPTQHYTIVFNTFVLMQIFNEINARKLYGEWNVFDGILNNPLYIAIILFTLGAQIIIVEFGGRAFSTEGLDGDQWLWCLLFGFLVLPWQFVINFLARVLPQTWLAADEFPITEVVASGESAGTPIAHSSPSAAHKSSFTAVNAVVKFLRSRTDKRDTVNSRIVDDLGLTSEGEARRTRRGSQIGQQLEMTRRAQMRSGTAPPTLEGGFFALAAAANKDGELDHLAQVAEEDEKKAEALISSAV